MKSHVEIASRLRQNDVLKWIELGEMTNSTAELEDVLFDKKVAEKLATVNLMMSDPIYAKVFRK